MPAQALVEDGLDELGLGEAGESGGAAEHLFGPEVGLEVELEEVERAALRVEAELEAAVIERSEFLGDAAGVLGDDRGPMVVLERDEPVFVLARDEVALLVIGAKVGRVGLLEQHHRHDHRLAVDGDHRHLDVAADEEGLDDRVVALAMDVGDGGAHAVPVVGVLDGPARGGGVGLDDVARGVREGLRSPSTRLACAWRSPSPSGAWGGTGAPRRKMAQGAVGSPRAAAQSLERCLSSARPRRIGEAPRKGMPARVQSKGASISLLRKPPRLRSGKTKSASGRSTRASKLFASAEVEAEALEDLAGLDMVERVVAVLGVEGAFPFGVLGDEQDPEAPLRFLRDRAGGDRSGHGRNGPFRHSGQYTRAGRRPSQQIRPRLVASKSRCKKMNVRVESVLPVLADPGRS